MQRALIQYRNPKNRELVWEALTKAGRTDLIGFDKRCLIRPGRAEEYRRTNDRGGREDKPGIGHGTDKKKGINDRRKADHKKTGKRKTIRNIHQKKGDRK